MSVHCLANSSRSKTICFLVITLCMLVFATSASAATVNCSGVAAWSGNSVAYSVGQLVTENGSEYKCLQSHTSQAGWDPASVPALWSLQGTCTAGATPTPTATAKPTATATATATAKPTATATATATAKPTATATATATPSGAGCWPAWVSTTAYNGGAQVSYNGENYQAAYWTQNNNPSTNNGPAGSGEEWIPEGACGGGPPPPTATPTATATGKPTATATATATAKPTATATPCTSCGGGSLPKHALMGYWQDFSNGAQVLTIAQVPTTYDVIIVAFANATGTPGAVSFSIDSGLASALGGYTDSQFIADINTAHSRGQKVIISVGGANGAISVSDSTSASNFANSVSGIMNQYGFDGVDIDLESGVNASVLSGALKQLAGMHSNLIVTAAPQTVDVQSSGNDYFQLALDLGSTMTVMNTQYYNSGSMNGCDGNVYSESTENFLTALACTQLKGLPAGEIGLGLPASPSGAGSGYTDPNTVVAALKCLATGSSCGSFNPGQTWPSIRGAMDWSINWDASNGYNFANTVKPGLNSLP